MNWINVNSAADKWAIEGEPVSVEVRLVPHPTLAVKVWHLDIGPSKSYGRLMEKAFGRLRTVKEVQGWAEKLYQHYFELEGRK